MEAARAASSSGSLSSARSQTASWPSPDVVVSTEDSKGDHSTDVTGPLQNTSSMMKVTVACQTYQSTVGLASVVAPVVGEVGDEAGLVGGSVSGEGAQIPDPKHAIITPGGQGVRGQTVPRR